MILPSYIGLDINPVDPPTYNYTYVPPDGASITMDSGFLYVCTANYDGSTLIWKKIALSAI